MQDYIVRAMAGNGAARVFAAVTTAMAEEARTIHHMNPTPCAALGRVLTGVALMSQTLKGDDHTITIQIRGDGPIGGILGVSDAKAGVRGYVHNPFFDVPLNDLGKFDIARAVGKGYLNVIKDTGLKEPYVGCVDLVSGEIAEDLTYYYAYSEQIPTAMNLGVLIGAEGRVEAAGGFLIQLMPDAGEDVITHLEETLKAFPPITNLIHGGNSPEDIIKILFPGESINILSTTPVQYRCNCSRERMERNLISIGREDLTDIASDEKGAELQCHFCNKKYNFTQNELLSLLENK